MNSGMLGTFVHTFPWVSSTLSSTRRGYNPLESRRMADRAAGALRAAIRIGPQWTSPPRSLVPDDNLPCRATFSRITVPRL
jgi:hypothetical protein